MRHHAVLAVTLTIGLAGCATTPPPVAPAGPAAAASDASDLQLPRPVPGTEKPAPEVPIALPVFPEEAYRAEQPKALAERPFKLPLARRFKMGPAVDVYLIEDHDLPVVSLDLDLAGGAMNDPADKVGLASICMSMLTEGTARLDKVAYSEALADIASSISSSAGDDRESVGLTTLKRNLPATFALYAETIASPGFRQVDFDRMIKRSLEGLKQAKASPGSIASRVGSVVVYGADHPLGRVTTEATLGHLTLDDCKAYHAAYLQPKGARLFVAGDISEAEVRQAFEPMFATWKKAPKRSVAMPGPAAPDGRVFFVNVPGAAQSQIAVVHAGPSRTAPSYFANTIMAQVLGGGFASRINMNLREDKGYSYGARGGFAYNKFFGRFAASAGVRTDASAQSTIEILAELAALKQGTRATTDAELDREKSGTILGLPGSFATSSGVLGMYRGLVYFGLPLDYYNHYVDRVKKVTAKAVADAARRELKPDRAHILVVGDGGALQVAYQAGVDGAAGKNVPMLGPDGKQMTLRQALATMLADGRLGKGALIELDADGRIVK